MTTRVCAVSFKECWQNEEGDWFSSGGFPLQMAAVASLFDSMTLLVTRSDRPGAGGIALPRNAEVHLLRRPPGRNLRRKLAILAHSREYFREIVRMARPADCVHVPPPGDLPLLGMLVGLVLRKRLIVRYCGSWFSTGSTTWMNRVTRGLMRAFAGGRNVMLATGEGERPPAARMHWVFATGLTTEELRRIRPVAGRGLSQPPRIAYIGRLSEEKGVFHLIDAVDRLARQGFEPIPEVTLIGDGPDRGALEQRARESRAASRFRFVGQVDRHALGALLHDLDFCVQPSLTEGYSKAWLDAFAYGQPVLSSEAGAARTVIGARGERGWLVPPGDLPALTDKLREVLSGGGDWPALRRRCREFAEGRTLENWSQRIGRVCAEQWGAQLINGKLRFDPREGAAGPALPDPCANR